LRGFNPDCRETCNEEKPAFSAGAEDFLRLKALLDSGALTEAEYESLKQRALQQI
jgi:hypothetical protein